MKSSKILIISLICLFALIPYANAEVLHPELVSNNTISFADLGLTGQQDIQIWQGNILIETANTTAGFIYAPMGDYFIVVKPALTNRWLNNPVMFLTDAVDYLLAFSLPIFMILGMAAILIGLSKRGRR